MTREKHLERMWRIRKQYLGYRKSWLRMTRPRSPETDADIRVMKARMKETKELFYELKALLIPNRNR